MYFNVSGELDFYGDKSILWFILLVVVVFYFIIFFINCILYLVNYLVLIMFENVEC